ncbi:SwmB domain-containing protein [Verminephrobacter aporrectodeae]|uniref:SwmB domain-containing protein n=1 Tax=Verminephrobacter aporrectodeae TaxID=1110389 RepID=UPI0003026584|nr:SwmB domain-containing protein [Verminephrobacter aporrectodeae]
MTTDTTTPDTTAPQLITTGATRPTASGNQLVLRFSDASNLHADPARKPAPGDFAVLVAGTPNAVTAVAVDGAAKTITLTLTTAVTVGQTATVAYTDGTPSDTSGIQDAIGNRLPDFAATEVNTTPDTTPPLLSSATVNGNQLVLTYTEATSLDAAALTGNAGFAVSGHGADGTAPIAYGVFSAVVNATAKTVTLTLKAPVLHGQRVTVSYTKPTTGPGVQDATGNEAANLIDQAVANNTSAEADTTPPVFRSATVNGNQLVLTYTEANNLEGAARTGSAGFAVNSAEGAAIPVTGIVVNATANTVTLTLGRAVTHTERLTVSYTKPGGNDVVQDATGNDAANLSNEAVSNDTPIPETVPPELGDVTVNGDQLELIYADENKLDAHHTAPASAFALSSSSDDVAIRVRSVAVTGKTVTLTLSRAVASDEVLTLSYTKPAGDNVIQDAASNDAPSFGKQDVENLTPEPTPALAPTPKPDPAQPNQTPSHSMRTATACPTHRKGRPSAPGAPPAATATTTALRTARRPQSPPSAPRSAAVPAPR